MMPVIRALYPVAKVQYWKASKEVNVTFFTVFKDFGTKEAWWWLLTKLWAMKVATNDEAPDMHYYGLVHPAVTDGSIRGWGWDANYKVAAGDAGNGGILAHEVGHNENRKHAPCGGPADVDPNWPDARYPNALIMESGFDINAREPRRWDDYEDVMAYCEKWISPHTYKALYNRFNTSSVRPAAEGDPIDHLVVSGFVADGGAVTLADFTHISVPAGQFGDPGTGLYAVSLLAADGRTLAVRRFETDSHLSQPGVGTFGVVLPYHPETRQIAILRGSATVATRAVSTSPPAIRVVSPNGGERIAATSLFTMSWTASDPDGDMLSYLVQYSRDGGATWRALDAGVAETEAVLDGALLAGSDRALVRVTASDGVNTSADQSDATFTVERKPPEAVIHTPDGTLVPIGAGLTLLGAAFDAEDGPLADPGLNWESDRDGPLGAGDELVAALSPGVHTITLRARDADGAVASDSIAVIVGDTPSRWFIPIGALRAE
jgi:hypothetical protein